MNDFQDKLQSAIDQGDPQTNGTNETIESLSGELSMREMLVTTFHGKMKIWSYVVYGYIFLFTGLAVASGVCFFQTTLVQWQIFWSALFVLAIMIVSIVKIWYWMLINRNAVTREIKRLELRIAELTERLPVGKE
jgi:hypothetical protein